MVKAFYIHYSVENRENNVTDLKSYMQETLNSNSYVCACKAKAVPVAL